jgi:hypothetical protein
MEKYDGSHLPPPQSYSRMLDDRVETQEKPYGYTDVPPAADSGNFDQAGLETKKIYKVKQ